MGGIILFFNAKTLKIASTAPAAPSKCPIDPLVEDTDKFFRSVCEENNDFNDKRYNAEAAIIMKALQEARIFRFWK